MATKEIKTKRTGEGRVQKKEAKQEPQKQSYLPYVAVVVAVAIIAGIIYFVGTHYVQTTFPAFKANLLAAPRVAITIGYSNSTQLGAMNPCFTNIVQYIAHNRNASTIDFFIVNQANATCLYSPTGLGHTIANIATQSASKCMAVANSEPGVFLNYTLTNSTIITLSHLYVRGNSNYMAACPIASDLG